MEPPPGDQSSATARRLDQGIADLWEVSERETGIDLFENL
jgi:hypothetical protein